MEMEGEVDLGEGLIVIQGFSFVVDITVRNYFLYLCDYYIYYQHGIQGNTYLILNKFHAHSCTFTYSICHRANRCVAADGEIA